jgi:hypothetical protein
MTFFETHHKDGRSISAGQISQTAHAWLLQHTKSSETLALRIAKKIHNCLVTGFKEIWITRCEDIKKKNSCLKIA